MPVSQPHKDYQKCLSQWELVRDCYEGTKKIKEASSGGSSGSSSLSLKGDKYLRVPNATDVSEENRQRFRDYLKGAVFVNFVGVTADAFHGMAFRRDPVIDDVPSQLEPMLKNFDGEGNSIKQCIKRSVHEGLLVAREGLLVDHPVSAGGTMAQTEGLHPHVKKYNAESIINWQTTVINGVSKLTMVVLVEESQNEVDEFTSECVKQYRVLKLTDGVYTQCLYDEKGNPIAVGTVIDENFEAQAVYDITPLDFNGNPFDEIPFIFIGAVNNDRFPDKPLLLDIAEVNIAHYQNSADFEESCFMVGQPTPVISGLTPSWYEDVLKNKIHLGSRGGIPLPEGGSAQLLQVSPNTMPQIGMEKKEQQMIKLGAKIIEDSSTTQETASAAKIRYAGQTSKLGTLVLNVGDAYKKALMFAGLFAGVEVDATVDVNTEFYENKLDPQEILAAIQLYDRQVVAMSDVRGALRQSGFVDTDRTDEDIEADLGEVNPIA